MPIALVFALSACGGGGGENTIIVTTAPPTTAPERTALRVYFLRNDDVQPVARGVEKTQAIAAAALEALFAGPASSERMDMRLRTEIPVDAAYSNLRIGSGTAHVDLSPDVSRAGLGQVVYTLTQFPTVTDVETGGKRYTRGDFEDEAPAILVESPLPFSSVRSPLRARGTANTFEATFEYDVVGPDGEVLAHDFVTATSGSGTRGTFEFTAPFTVAASGEGKLIVFESSAKDGSRIHIVEIPLQLEQ